MIGERSDLKVVLVSGPIDFRAGINRLALLVANELGRDPYSNDVFVFRSKRMDGRVPRGGVGTVDLRQDRVQVRRPVLAS